MSHNEKCNKQNFSLLKKRPQIYQKKVALAQEAVLNKSLAKDRLVSQLSVENFSSSIFMIRSEEKEQCKKNLQSVRIS